MLRVRGGFAPVRSGSTEKGFIGKPWEFSILYISPPQQPLTSLSRSVVHALDQVRLEPHAGQPVPHPGGVMGPRPLVGDQQEQKAQSHQGVIEKIRRSSNSGSASLIVILRDNGFLNQLAKVGFWRTKQCKFWRELCIT